MCFLHLNLFVVSNSLEKPFLVRKQTLRNHINKRNNNNHNFRLLQNHNFIFLFFKTNNKKIEFNEC